MTKAHVGPLRKEKSLIGEKLLIQRQNEVCLSTIQGVADQPHCTMWVQGLPLCPNPRPATWSFCGLGKVTSPHCASVSEALEGWWSRHVARQQALWSEPCGSSPPLFNSQGGGALPGDLPCHQRVSQVCALGRTISPLPRPPLVRFPPLSLNQQMSSLL